MSNLTKNALRLFALLLTFGLATSASAQLTPASTPAAIEAALEAGGAVTLAPGQYPTVTNPIELGADLSLTIVGGPGVAVLPIDVLDLSGNDITLGTGLTLELTRNVVINFENGDQINGAGTLALTTSTGEVTLSTDAVAGTAVIQNLLVNKPSGVVSLITGSADPLLQSIFQFGVDGAAMSSLNVVSGTINAGRNNIEINGGDAAVEAEVEVAVSIAPNAFINGSGSFDVDIKEEAAVTFTGAGQLNMLLLQTGAPGGVTYAFTRIGNGGDSRVLNNTATFSGLTHLDGNLTVGDNVGLAGTAVVNITPAVTITNDLTVATDGDIWFLGAATIQDDVTNDGTIEFSHSSTIAGDFTQGATGLLDLDADHLVTADVSQLTQINGAVTITDTDADVVLPVGDDPNVLLDEDDAALSTRYHNLAIAGNLTFVTQEAEFVYALLGNYASGNKVILNGQNSLQQVTTVGTQSIEDLEIAAKNGSKVNLNGTTLNIPGSLLVTSGDLETDGLLDAGTDVTVNWVGSGRGQILSGTAASAYAAAGEPTEVRYTGNTAIFTGDELPGPSSGGVVNTLTVELTSADPYVTLGKDMLIAANTGNLRLIKGNLDVGSAELEFGNRSTITIGDGSLEIRGANPVLGQVTFPDVKAVDAPGLPDEFQAGEDGINLVYVPTTARTTSLEWNPALPNVVLDVTVNTPTTGSIALNTEAGTKFRLNGDLTVTAGTLQLAGDTLEINAVNTFDGVVNVATAGNIVDAAGTALIKFTGTEQTDFTAATSNTVKTRVFPAAEVARATVEGDVNFFVTAGVAADRLEFKSFTVSDADNVVVDEEIETFAATSYYLQDAMFSVVTFESDADILDNEAVVTGTTFTTYEGVTNVNQRVVNVGSDFTLGATVPNSTATFASAFDTDVDNDADAVEADDDAWMVMTVGGDFTVNADSLASSTTLLHRTTYFLGNGELHLNGNYTFLGRGDVANEGGVPAPHGLIGTVYFNADDDASVVTVREDEDTNFDDVVMDGDAGAVLASNVVVNEVGAIFFVNGVVDGDTNAKTVTLLNTAIDIMDRNPGPGITPSNNAISGTVIGGTRDSFIDGVVVRDLTEGQATGGTVQNGYLFPLGMTADDETIADRAFWAPIVLQFATNGKLTNSTADIVKLDSVYNKANYSTFEVATDAGPRALALNTLSDVAYKVTFDEIPSEDPNIRIVADFLPMASVRDIKSLRIVQLPCEDGPNFSARLAGVYDLADDPGTDDESFNLNDFINGVPNVIQEGVDVETCQIFAVATDALINPIDVSDATDDYALVQLIHASPDAGTLDEVAIDGRNLISDFEFGEATPYINLPVTAGELDIVLDGHSYSQDVTPGGRYVMVIVDHFGPKGLFDIVKIEDARNVARNDAMVEAVFVNGLEKEVDFVDFDAKSVLANNVAADKHSSYVSLDPATVNLELVDDNAGASLDVFQAEFGQYTGEGITVVAAGTSADAALLLVDPAGHVATADVVTDVEDAELPTEFAVNGNYPNPFNPTTTISFNLPEAAQVSVEVIDMLGRRVMTVPAQAMQAGANKTLRVDAGMLASGAYVYRVVAKAAAKTFVQSGQMILVK